ncbi:hypothetical protein CGMCC3_g5557 [Colletotrichum fructicola]|nr:uncharacterized protein CGMCC3_g5557 [Colletotrichum fructicola]KAE9578346.1 hypothetical protein CGMCC3_g5557 [Colletotrichum fructicola]
MYEDYEHPPHPFTKFSCKELRALTGWFPSKWKEIDMDIWLIESFNDDKWGPYQPSKIVPDGVILEEMEKRGKIVKVKAEGWVKKSQSEGPVLPACRVSPSEGCRSCLPPFSSPISMLRPFI